MVLISAVTLDNMRVWFVLEIMEFHSEVGHNPIMRIFVHDFGILLNFENFGPVNICSISES